MTGNFPVGGPVPRSFGPGYAPPLKRSRAGVWLGAVAVVLATAALVVGIIALNIASHAQASVAVMEQEAKKVENAEQADLFVDSVDRSLCEGVGPLMKESRTMKNAFSDVGAQGSPEQRAAIPKFVSDTREWANRTQLVLNEHSDTSRYLTRTLQRYIDDMLLFVGNISPERNPDPADAQAWDLSIVDLRGPRGRCRDVGVDWWS